MTDNHYETVIIGSGLGGLLSAVILAREGQKVAVIEQNRQTGGCLQTFSFGKKVFDSCVHYIGALEEGQAQNRIFRYAGIMDDLSLQRLDMDCFDEIILGDGAERFPQAQGTDNFVAQLRSRFPREEKALKTYMQMLQRVADSFPLYQLRTGDESEKEWVSLLEVSDTLGRITTDPLLQQVLAGNNLLYAGQRGKTPFYVHALVLKSFIDSAYKCDGGSSQISRLLVKKLREYGGSIFTKTKIVQLAVRDGRVRYARTEQGSPVYGNRFIVNAHPANLPEWIDGPALRPAYRKRILQAENTVAAFMVNIILKPGTIRYRNRNSYWNRTGDVFSAASCRPDDWPENYALYFGKDKQNEAYADTLAILTYMPAGEWEAWAHTRNSTYGASERAPSYHEQKARKAARLIEKVSEQFPGLKENIAAMKVATPLTFRDYMGTTDGSMYGIVKNVHAPAQGRIPVHTRIPNLFLTGQNINLHGVLGVSITAVSTCAAITGREYLLHKINKS